MASVAYILAVTGDSSVPNDFDKLGAANPADTATDMTTILSALAGDPSSYPELRIVKRDSANPYA